MAIQDELTESQKMQFSELEKLSHSIALNAAKHEVDEEIMRNPQIENQRDRQIEAHYSRNQKEIIDALSEHFLSFTKVNGFLAPLLAKSSPIIRDIFLRDQTKLINLADYVNSDDDQLTLQKYCGISNESLEFLYDSAHEAMCDKRFEEASVILKYLNLLNPFFPQSWLLLGYCLKEQGHYEMALKTLKAAALLDPNFADAKLYAIETYLALNKLADAKLELKKLEALLPDHRDRDQLKAYINFLKNEINQGEFNE